VFSRSSALAPDGTLYQFAKYRGSPQNMYLLVLRRPLTGAADIVYDEADEPHVTGYTLFTGP
jgi:hypothetical protein